MNELPVQYIWTEPSKLFHKVFTSIHFNMTFLHRAHFLTLLMERWASVHISTSVVVQRDKYITSLSSSLNEQLEGANIKAQSPSSQPARSRSLRSTSKNIRSLWGAEAARTRLAMQSCKQSCLEHLSWAAPSTHGIPQARHRKSWKQLANSTYFLQAYPSPGGCCTPRSPWRGAGEELLPASAHSSPSPILSNAGALPLGCLIWLPLQKAQKESGTVWIISERSYFCFFLLSKPASTSNSLTSLPVFFLSADTSLQCIKSSLSLLHIFKHWIRWCLWQAGGSASSFHTGKV